MAAELFVDTSAWYPIADKSVAGAVRVRKALQDRVTSGVRIVTTNLVVAETHALLLRRVGRAVALAFARNVVRAPNVIVTSDPDLEAVAVSDWLGRFDDQPFSFTDAVSFATMKARGIREALTLDRHFAIAGFLTLPA